MFNFKQFQMLDFSIQLVLSIWLLILLKKSKQYGFEMTEMEFAAPVLIVIPFLFIVEQAIKYIKK